MTPNKPSEPVKRASRSNPGASKASDPNTSSSPSIVSTLSCSMLCRVSPYFRQWTPPEFYVTVTPIEQAICGDWSVAKYKPYDAADCEMARVRYTDVTRYSS